MCGIDEAGRGCIAGSLVVAGVVLHETIDALNDSKALSEKKRKILYEEIIQKSTYHIVAFDAAVIDEKGLSFCMSHALKQIMATIKASHYLFDGNTTFGVKNLHTMVKADAQVPQVMAASIVAKVTRDEAILKAHAQVPHYGFDTNKGYGSRAHIEAIKQYGYSTFHRKSFRLKALEPTLFDIRL